MHTSCPSQNQSKNSRKPSDCVFSFLHVYIYESVIFLYCRERNGQNCAKSLFLNAFINVEMSFLFTNWLSVFFIADKIGHCLFYSNWAVVLTWVKGSNRITLRMKKKNLKF